jgi:hypothetical protein
VQQRGVVSAQLLASEANVQSLTQQLRTEEDARAGLERSNERQRRDITSLQSQLEDSEADLQVRYAECSRMRRERQALDPRFCGRVCVCVCVHEPCI